MPRSNRLKVSDDPSSSGTGMLSDPYCKLQRAGCVLTSDGKVAIVLVLEEIEEIEKTSDSSFVNSEGNENAHLLIKALLDDHSRFVKVMLRHYDSIKDVRILSHDNSHCFHFLLILFISVMWYSWHIMYAI